MSDIERKIAEYEASRNDAVDRYFDARPHLERSREQERFVEEGFRLAWEQFGQDLKQSQNILPLDDSAQIYEINIKAKFPHLEAVSFKLKIYREGLMAAIQDAVDVFCQLGGGSAESFLPHYAKAITDHKAMVISAPSGDSTIEAALQVGVPA